jgi:class 3 adenylate cyclase
MPDRGASRRLTTVMFLDIVGSTRVASEIGDRRWKGVLEDFQRLVRAQFKRFNGIEEEWTGDGFLATFQAPLRGVEAAGAIAAAVQRLGLEVRLGLHTGECEVVDGKLAGLAVHLGARVMSLAGPAQVLVTGTVKDLVIGSGIEFEPFGSHELKGVPGTWPLFRVTRIDGESAPAPLAEEEAAGRLAAWQPVPLLRRRRRAALALSALIVVAGALLGTRFALHRAPITLVRLDPSSGRVVETLRDAFYSHHLPASLLAENGSLWQYIPGVEVIRRDVRTGHPELSFSIGKVDAGTLGFGSVWAATDTASGTEISRYDEATGRRQGAPVNITGVKVVSMSAGDDGMWALGSDGTLLRIDPLTDSVTEQVRTPTISPGVVVALAGYVWICDCNHGHVIQFDPGNRTEVRSLDLKEHGFLVDVDAQHAHTVWLLDPSGNTLTRIDPNTGQQGQPRGFGGHVTSAVIGFGDLWVAASNAVYRINLSTGDQTTIPIPGDMTAGSIAVDEQTDSVWVGNCGCPRNG